MLHRTWGEAGRSAGERSAEHLQDLKAKKEDSHMFKHQQLEHPDTNVTFTMKVLRKHSSAFSRMVEESTLISLNQNTSKILNSKSGFNRSQIPRLTVSMGDRVVSDTIKADDYSQGQVEEIISDNNRRQNKTRGRGMGDDTNICAPQPPLKRRKFQYAKRKTSTSKPDSDNDQSNVPGAPGQASLVKNSEQQYDELDIVDSQTSPSSNLNLTFPIFPIFTRMQNGETPLSSKEKSSFTKSKIRKPGKKLKGYLPPPPNNIITNHIEPISNSP